MKKKLVTCPECGGQGGFMAGHNSFDSINCLTCSGKRKVTEQQVESYRNRKKEWTEAVKKAKKWLKENK